MKHRPSSFNTPSLLMGQFHLITSTIDESKHLLSWQQQAVFPAVFLVPPFSCLFLYVEVGVAFWLWQLPTCCRGLVSSLCSPQRELSASSEHGSPVCPGPQVPVSLCPTPDTTQFLKITMRLSLYQKSNEHVQVSVFHSSTF